MIQLTAALFAVVATLSPVGAFALSARQDAAAPISVPLVMFPDGGPPPLVGMFPEQKFFGAQVTVGTPPQTMRLALNLERQGVTVVDYINTCLNITECRESSLKNNTFIPQDSTSLVPGTSSETAMYWIDTTTYNVSKGTDEVSIAGLNAANMVVEVSSSFATTYGRPNGNPVANRLASNSSVLGLGLQHFGSIFPSTPPEVEGWIKALQANNLPTRFALALDRNPANYSGTLLLGGDDATLYEEPLTQTPTADDGMWTVVLDGMSVDNTSVADMATAHAFATARGGQPLNMLMDPSFETIALPEDTISKVMRVIAGSSLKDGEWTVPCDSAAKLTLTFGGQVYPIATNTWLNGTKNSYGTCKTFFAVPHVRDGKPSTMAPNVYAMGPMMRNLYASYVYGAEGCTIGLAKAVGTTPKAPPPVTEAGQAGGGVGGATETGASASGQTASGAGKLGVSVIVMVGALGVGLVL